MLFVPAAPLPRQKVAPVLAGSNTYTGSSTTNSVPLPSGVAAGDLILLVCAVGGTTTISTPSGYTQLFTATNGGRLSVFYKIAAGGETSVSVSIASANDLSVVTLRITGGGTPGAATSVTANSTASSNPPSITPSSGGPPYLIVAVSGINSFLGDNTISSYPSGYSSGVCAHKINISAAAAAKTVQASSEDPGAFTWSGSGNVIANTIAVPPV